MHYYWGFGLYIASEIIFPELIPIFAPEKPDVFIYIGNTPEKLPDNDVITNPIMSANAVKYLLKVPGIANYFVENGNKIVVSYKNDVDLKSVRLFLLSNAMTAILHQRNKFVLHASAVYSSTTNKLILFCGKSGAGKSTFAMALKQRGYNFFSDDVCILEAKNELVYATASYPMAKLWEDSHSKIGIKLPTAEDKVRPHLAKYAHWHHDGFNTQSLPIEKIFVLTPSLGEAFINVEHLPPITAFGELLANVYRPMQLTSMQKTSIPLHIISKIVEKTPVYKVVRSTTNSKIEDQLTQLTAILEKDV